MAVSSAFLSPTALVTRGLGNLRLRGRPHTHHALPEQEATCRAGPDLQLDGLRDLGQAVAGSGEKRVRGQKPQIPIPVCATCPFPGPTGSPNTCLTSGRRCGWGGLGSRHCRNRLRTVLGHLQGEG